MPKYTELDMQNAIADVENGTSRHVAASRWGIPRSTLLGRLRGAGPREQAHSDRQSLSPTEEHSLAEWARIQYALGLPPTHQQLRLVAQHLLRRSGSSKTLGKNWTTGFLGRHESLKVLQGKQTEKARVDAVTPDKIKDFFNYLEELILKQIRLQNCWNMDETGIMEGILWQKKVIVLSDKKNVVLKV